MTDTYNDVQRWIKTGKSLKATHLIVICDTFSYEDYPIYAHGEKDCKAKAKSHNGPNMQSVHEIINLSSL